MQHKIAGRVRSLAVRVGHDAVWVAIAGLFCIVEGAVKLTEFAPAKTARAYPARHVSTITTPVTELALR